MSKMKFDSKLIFRNTVFLYLREGFSLIISLLTSRILLKELGADDYGLYGLVGSILTIFSAIRILFSSSIQRFINLEKGAGNVENISKIFSIGVIIHIVLQCKHLN